MIIFMLKPYSLSALGLGSTKALIISILSEEHPLSAKQLFERVKKETDSQITYQAVHKTLAAMAKESILTKSRTGFEIDEKWINNIKRFGESISQTCGKGKTVEQPERPEVATFDSFLELARFILNEFFIEYPNPEKKAHICYCYHNYGPFGLSEKENENYRKIVSGATFHLGITKGNTYFDHWVAKYLTGLGKKCVTGVDFAINEETYINGDYVCQVFLPLEFKQGIDALYNQITSIENIDMQKMFSELLAKKVNIIAVITKNKILADRLRADGIAIYEKNKKKGK